MVRKNQLTDFYYNNIERKRKDGSFLTTGMPFWKHPVNQLFDSFINENSLLFRVFSEKLISAIVSYMHTTREVLVYYSVVNISIVIYTSTKFETNDRRESILIIVLSFSSVSRCVCVSLETQETTLTRCQWCQIGTGSSLRTHCPWPLIKIWWGLWIICDDVNAFSV